jgi:hypothetical protein
MLFSKEMLGETKKTGNTGKMQCRHGRLLEASSNGIASLEDSSNGCQLETSLRYAVQAGAIETIRKHLAVRALDSNVADNKFTPLGWATSL